MADEHATTYENPFKFSGKEQDGLTGLYDHGARSRDPKICGWLNIDPLYELYPDASPYVYCHGNPVRFSDPTGMVECDENGNIVVDYNPERVNALIQSRLNDPDISDGAKSVYNSMLPLSSDGSVDMSVPPTINSDGIIYTVGIAKTDAGSEFLVLTTQQGSIDNKSNCAGISLLGGQAGTLTGYETDIILRDEFTPSSANMNVNDVVTWGHRVTNENNQIQKTSNGNDMVSTDHVSRRLVSGKSSNGNELSRFINKNGYGGRARISVREGLDNARRSASQGLEKFGDRLCVVSFYTPKPKRVNPFNVHPNNR